jgi:hypothetical protein
VQKGLTQMHIFFLASVRTPIIIEPLIHFVKALLGI